MSITDGKHSSFFSPTDKKERGESFCTRTQDIIEILKTNKSSKDLYLFYYDYIWYILYGRYFSESKQRTIRIALACFLVYVIYSILSFLLLSSLYSCPDCYNTCERQEYNSNGSECGSYTAGKYGTVLCLPGLGTLYQPRVVSYSGETYMESFPECGNDCLLPFQEFVTLDYLHPQKGVTIANLKLNSYYSKCVQSLILKYPNVLNCKLLCKR